MRRSYDTDLIEEQWLKIANLYPIANHRGRPRTIDFREITNAILYLVRAGCPWRLLPHDRWFSEAHACTVRSAWVGHEFQFFLTIGSCKERTFCFPTKLKILKVHNA